MSATIDEATWVLTSYLVANAIILPMTGWLAATFGRKRLLMMSVTGFTVVVVSVRHRAEPRLADCRSASCRARPAARCSRCRRRCCSSHSSRTSAARRWASGARHRRRADPRPGARRLADRQLQLAMGVLHQPAGRHRVDHHDEDVHLRSAVPAARDARRSTTGASACSSSASARCSTCSTRGRRTTGLPPRHDHDAGDRVGVTLVVLVVHELDDRASRSSICACSRSAAMPPGSS